jgi:murein DD-endopeptidase MepM/ murein hydrolase activator NlpD
VRSKLRVRPRAAGKIGVMAAIMLLAIPVAGASAATTGGAPTPAAVTAPAPGSGPGTPAAAPSAGTLSLVGAETTPVKSFFYGYRLPRLSYTIASSQPYNDIRIDVLNSVGEVVKTFYREDRSPNVPYRIRWDGTTNEGKPARNGRYSFQISAQSAAPTPPPPAARPATASTTLGLSFTFFGYAFPILGDHEYSLSAGRFGAGRSGHTHQGQDVMAACGLPLVAARGGRVQYAGWDDGGGNYIVIDGQGTANDFVYMHMLEPSLLKVGETVRTGQPIGLVGTTGSSSGCHLHFEIWSGPGWYEDGSPFDPLAELQKWDRYS